MISKADVHTKMVEILNQRISDLKHDIDASKESRNTATKSSAGDKHETSRAMLQAELDNKEVQLSKTLKQRYDLKEINPSSQSNHIKLGSLVYTSAGVFYISIGMGKIVTDFQTIFAISPVSPVGTALLNSGLSHKIDINNKEIIINSVL